MENRSRETLLFFLFFVVYLSRYKLKTRINNVSLLFFFHSPLFFFAINPIVESISTIYPLTFGWNVESRSKRKISMLFFLLSPHVSLLCDKKKSQFLREQRSAYQIDSFPFFLSLFSSTVLSHGERVWTFISSTRKLWSALSLFTPVHLHFRHIS